MDFQTIVAVVFVLFCVFLSTKVGKNAQKVAKSAQKEIKETIKEAKEASIEIFGKEISDEMFDRAEDALEDGVKTVEDIAKEWIEDNTNDFTEDDYYVIVKFLTGAMHED